jgi:hypothetical protein
MEEEVVVYIHQNLRCSLFCCLLFRRETSHHTFHPTSHESNLLGALLGVSLGVSLDTCLALTSGSPLTDILRAMAFEYRDTLRLLGRWKGSRESNSGPDMLENRGCTLARANLADSRRLLR